MVEKLNGGWVNLSLRLESRWSIERERRRVGPKGRARSPDRPNSPQRKFPSPRPVEFAGALAGFSGFHSRASIAGLWEARPRAGFLVEMVPSFRTQVLGPKSEGVALFGLRESQEARSALARPCVAVRPEESLDSSPASRSGAIEVLGFHVRENRRWSRWSRSSQAARGEETAGFPIPRVSLWAVPRRAARAPHGATLIGWAIARTTAVFAALELSGFA